MCATNIVKAKNCMGMRKNYFLTVATEIGLRRLKRSSENKEKV